MKIGKVKVHSKIEIKTYKRYFKDLNQLKVSKVVENTDVSWILMLKDAIKIVNGKCICGCHVYKYPKDLECNAVKDGEEKDPDFKEKDVYYSQ